MSVDADGLSALRAHAIASSEDLISLLDVARTLGLDVPSNEEIRDPLARLGDFDVAGLSDDAHRLTLAHRAVAEQLHRLPEQQIRLDDSWSGMSGRAAMAQVVAHQRRAEAELGVLRTLSEATVAASSGIDRLLRTWYLTVARCASPFVSGVPLPDLPSAVLTGRVPLPLVAADVASRISLFRETAETTMTSVLEILHALNRATEDLDSHDRDGRSAFGTHSSPSPSSPSPSSPSPSSQSPSSQSPSSRSDLSHVERQWTSSVEPDASPQPTSSGTAQPANPPTHGTDGAPSPPETGRSEEGVDVPFTLSHEATEGGGEQSPAGDEAAGAEQQVPLPAQPAPPAEQPAPEPAPREPGPPSPESAAPDPGRAESDLALAGDQ